MPPRFNIPPVTRLLLITLVVQFCLSAAIRYQQWSAANDIVVPYLSLIPQLSLIYPWTFLTTTLSEQNVFTLGISGGTLFYGGRYLERAWTSAEFAKFVAICSLIPNVLCFGILVILFAVTSDMRWTLTSINGTIALQSAFLIAFSQLVPTHTVTLFKGIISLKVPRFPLIHILTVFLLSLTPLLTTASFILAILGFITSWTYLRFYKHAFPDLDSSQPSSLRGDASESFAFATFFPNAAQPFVVSLSNSIYNLLVSLHVCVPFTAADMSGSRGENFASRAAGGARAEAERRRALALKALDQRLHAATAGAANKQQPKEQMAGPSVQMQPKANGQTAMTSQEGAMLGETSYVPEGEEKDGH